MLSEARMAPNAMPPVPHEAGAEGGAGEEGLAARFEHGVNVPH